jgi:hypothetical protein
MIQTTVLRGHGKRIETKKRQRSKHKKRKNGDSSSGTSMGTDEPNHLEFVVLPWPRVGPAARCPPRLLVHDGTVVPRRRRQCIVIVAEHVADLVVDQVLTVEVS